jgi:hypothetical protein
VVVVVVVVVHVIFTNLLIDVQPFPR